MKCYFALSILLLCTLAARAHENEKWQLFKPQNGRFAITMPGVPTEKYQEVSTEIGALPTNIYMYQPKTGEDSNVLYGFIYADYPTTMIHSDSSLSKLEMVFDNARDGAVRRVQGKLLSETKVAYKGFPGREMQVDFKNGLAVIRMRFYLVKNRMYMIQVITLTENNFNTSISRFMNSFELTEG